MLSHNNLMAYYKNVFALAQHHKYTISDIENLLPYERDLYLDMLIDFIETTKQQQQSQEIKMAKKLQNGSKLESADLDGDGIVTDEELDMQERMIMLENEDKKQDAQRNMAWFALAGMLLYPFAVVIGVALNLVQASEILGDMASVYFVSVAAIVAAFYGSQAYTAKAVSKPVAKKAAKDDDWQVTIELAQLMQH